MCGAPRCAARRRHSAHSWRLAREELFDRPRPRPGTHACGGSAGGAGGGRRACDLGDGITGHWARRSRHLGPRQYTWLWRGARTGARGGRAARGATPPPSLYGAASLSRGGGTVRFAADRAIDRTCVLQILQGAVAWFAPREQRVFLWLDCLYLRALLSSVSSPLLIQALARA